MSRILKLMIMVITTLITIASTCQVMADTRFQSSYSCQDSKKKCLSKGVKNIDGFDVERECWSWVYEKTCSYPSKNDCNNYMQCYAIGDVECLLKDSQGSCVNMKKEFSCKRHEYVSKEDKSVRMGFEEIEGQEGLVCNGIPCIDGNCFDKSYRTNGEMMDALSKLSMVSNMNPDADQNFNLFAGNDRYCSKKTAGYSNCCREVGKGWGENLGAHCTKDEVQLAKDRGKNLCVYLGKVNKGKMKTVVKHHFCCFPTLLDKVVQVGAKVQGIKDFGTPDNPKCNGLTLEEFQRINFSKVDFSEFIEDFKLKFKGEYNAPKAGDLMNTIEGSISSIRKYDGNQFNKENKMTGWNMNIEDDSWEAHEERRLEEERLAELERQRLARLAELERQRLAKLEAERLERERLEAEKKRLAALEIEKQKKRAEYARERKAINERYKREYASAWTVYARRERWLREQARYWQRDPATLQKWSQELAESSAECTRILDAQNAALSAIDKKYARWN